MTVIIPLSTMNAGLSLDLTESTYLIDLDIIVPFLSVENDYSGVPTNVSFIAPLTQICFDVQLTDDNVHELTEGFNINLNLDGSDVSTGMFPTTTVKIFDRDSMLLRQSIYICINKRLQCLNLRLVYRPQSNVTKCGCS